VLVRDYPNRSITLIVPSPAGGGTDTQARILAPKLSEMLGQTVIIEIVRRRRSLTRRVT
jgi:tripartite-type tricarboxylate transporter receptor subunit TctC